MVKLLCPRCDGKVFKTKEKGAPELGEDTKKDYERYNCRKCKLFWEYGDVLVQNSVPQKSVQLDTNGGNSEQ